MNRRRYLHQLAVLGLGATAAPILRADGPVPSGTSRMKQGSLSRVSPEQLLLWDPEVIVTQDAGFAQRVRTDPLWRDISAVRTGRIHCAPSLPFGWLDSPPSVNRLIGVRWLLEKLHPGHPALRARVALPEETQHFYRLFYGASLSVQEVKRLLG